MRGIAHTDRARTPVDAGYAIFSNVFQRFEIEHLLEALSADRIERTRAGARRILGIPTVHQLANDAPSSKSADDRRRRVLHIEYASTVRLASHVELSVG